MPFACVGLWANSLPLSHSCLFLPSCLGFLPTHQQGGLTARAWALLKEHYDVAELFDGSSVLCGK